MTCRSGVLVPGTRARFVHSEKMTTAYWTFEPGAVLPAHAHPHEQVTNVLEGEFEMTVAGQVRIIRPGDVAVIPPDVTHSGKALVRCPVHRRVLPGAGGLPLRRIGHPVAGSIKGRWTWGLTRTWQMLPGSIGPGG